MKIKLANYGTRTKNVKKGDFVQKVWWYGDVWAEVLEVWPSKDFKSITYACCDNRYGSDSVYESLRGEHSRYFQVADVCTRAQLKKKSVRILHLKEGSYGYNRPGDRRLPGWPKWIKFLGKA